MKPTDFKQEFDELRRLDNSEGPTRNVLEPKFLARAKAETLLHQLKGVLSNTSSESAELQRQLTQLLLFLGTNYVECDEEREGDRHLRTAYALACLTLQNTDVTQLPEPTPLSSILKDEVCLEGRAAEDLVRWMDALNCIGVYLSNRSGVQEAVQDARHVLHKCENASTALAKSNLPQELAVELEEIMTRNVFYLAQTYGALGDSRSSSKYVHQTMARQLRTRVEFSAKEWATNAVHLAGFYAGEGHFDCALHCLSAARKIMPRQPSNEETTGVVAWGFGKVWKALLRKGATQLVETSDAGVPAPVPWWVDFPVERVDPPAVVHEPTTFESARGVFRSAVLELQDAATYYTFDTCCPDHIAIFQDVAECYKHLAEFEKDPERKAAMLTRRIGSTVKFPPQLAFQAYATLIRQLWYDLGEAATDLFEFRLNQKNSATGRPLSHRQLNFLCNQALGFFNKFLDTVGSQPLKKVDGDIARPCFRVLMRIARLEGKRFPATAKEEFDNIGKSIDGYESVIKFVEANNLDSNAELQIEIDLARQMKQLLPSKRRDLQKVFS